MQFSNLKQPLRQLQRNQKLRGEQENQRYLHLSLRTKRRVRKLRTRITSLDEVKRVRRSLALYDDCPHLRDFLGAVEKEDFFDMIRSGGIVSKV